MINGWPNLVDFIFILLGVATWNFSKYIYYRIRKHYRWKCPVCGFKIATDNKQTFEISVLSHNHASLREYK